MKPNQRSMNNRMCIMVLLLMTSMTFGQQIPENFTFVGNVLSDTTDLDSNILKEVLPPILDSKNTIEIRFIVAPDMKIDTLITLFYNGKWNAKKYNLDTNKEIKLGITTEKQLAEIFHMLVDNEVFNLPNKSSINIAATYIDLNTGERMQMLSGVLHATTYIVQFKVGNQFRLYGFSSPEPYVESHPKIREFKYYTNIIKIFQNIK